MKYLYQRILKEFDVHGHNQILKICSKIFYNIHVNYGY